MTSTDDDVAMASMVGVAAAGFRLSLMLNAVSCEVANEGLEVHSIAKTITLFSLVLKQAGTALQAQDSVHSRNAFEGVNTIAKNTTLIFDEFNDMLERVQAKPTDGSTMPSIHQRFKACFKTQRVQYLLAQLDTHKLSLLLIFKVLELGKLMASTWQNDLHTQGQAQLDLINQERLETQNVLIVRYWQMNKVNRLYEAAWREENGDSVPVGKKDTKPNSRPSSSHMAVEAAPIEYAEAVLLAQLPNYSLGELDQTLNKIKQSPKEMVRVSSEAIGPLLDRWTRWEEVQQRAHRRGDSGRHNAPSVDQMNDDEDDRQYYQRFRERGDSPKGIYLEGTTTDWRKPHSVAAMEEAKRRRQKYKGYQPSALEVSSDEDDSGDSTKSKKKKSARRHIIESGSDLSTSEDEYPRNRRPQMRRSSTSERSSASERRRTYAELTPTAHPSGASQNNTHQPPAVSIPVSPHLPQRGPSPRSPGAMPSQMPDRRDLETMTNSNSATSQQIHHTNGHHTNGHHTNGHHMNGRYPNGQYPNAQFMNSKLPNAQYTAGQHTNGQYMNSHHTNGRHSYQQPQQLQQPQQPYPATVRNVSPVYPHGPVSSPSTAQARYTPQAPSHTWMAVPQWTSPQEARRGRHSSHIPPAHGPYQHPSYSLSTSHLRPRHSRSSTDEKKQSTKQNLREGATKGLLGAGAIAGFLEALESLSL